MSSPVVHLAHYVQSEFFFFFFSNRLVEWCSTQTVTTAAEAALASGHGTGLLSE